GLDHLERVEALETARTRKPADVDARHPTVGNLPPDFVAPEARRKTFRHRRERMILYQAMIWLSNSTIIKLRDQLRDRGRRPSVAMEEPAEADTKLLLAEY